MAGITGLGTTYNLPNFTGPLFQLTPSDTPLLSALGGLTSGRQSTATRFEWQTFDLRTAGQNVALEGAAAPTAQARVRATANNVCQIHQEAVNVSYTALATPGQLSGLATAGQSNPVNNELAFQLEQTIKQVARDVNFSFINGTYQLPGDNSTARKTRGLNAAITSNVVTKGTTLGTGLSITASTDLITSASHGLANGTRVKVTNLVTTTGIVEGGCYFVVSQATNTFKFSHTLGGSVIDLVGDGTADITVLPSALSEDIILDGMQKAYDNGGLSEDATRTLLVNSRQRRAVTNAFAESHRKANPVNGNVGGVSVQQIETDFGTLNVMLDRAVHQDTALILSLEQLAPVFLEVPGKGHFFVEPLAKTGANDQAMLYGEVGLAYGNELAHAKITGLS